jgi:transcriptional regulator with XRE-family HTH domain
MHFTEKLRLLMRRHGLTQTSLGAQLGVSQRAVGKWLAGDSSPGADVAKRLAEFLRVPIDDLLDDACDLPPDIAREEQRARHAKAAAAADKIPSDQPLAKQATYLSVLEREHHILDMKDLARRLRAMADEIDPEHAAAERDLQKAKAQGKFKTEAPPGQKSRPA